MPRADAAPAVHRRRAALGGVLLICLGLPASRASTLVVDLDGGGHFTSIQAALDEAASGDTVLVRPGEYVIDEPIDFSRGLYPGQRLGDGDRSIALRSEAGAPATVIRMSESGGSSGRASLLVFESGETESTVVDGFTLTAGRGTLVGGSTYGGGVYCANGSSPILENLVIARNRATYGGALFCGDSSPRLVGCTLEANSVTCGGGAFCDAASPRFERCRIIGNRGMYASSGVHSKNGSAPTLIGCVVMGNATYMGGGVDGFGSWPTLINCVVAGNSAWKGAALYGEGSAFVVRSCTIADNRSGGGAGIFVQASSLEMVNTIVWPRESAPVSYLGSFCLTDVDPLFVSGGSFDLERFRILEIA
ncbi:MAG: right-handed parallel beta-helix repeat-containing protein, partial [Planctomycetes bacterium]|nr:right-handed parallel beta-helix repeat-containing protein [Planctomycetota bacterium]